MGGTFDPIHFGHLITASRLLEIRDLEKIIFVPCHISPHKTERQSAPPVMRLEMTALAIKNDPRFELCDFEVKNRGISYTVDTLKYLKRKYDRLELIIGYDNIEKFHTWKNPDELLELARLVIMKRSTDKEIAIKDKYFRAAEFIETPVIEIAATDIRERVRRGLPIDYLVPAEVRDYIFQNNLYRNNTIY